MNRNTSQARRAFSRSCLSLASSWMPVRRPCSMCHCHSISCHNAHGVSRSTSLAASRVSGICGSRLAISFRRVRSCLRVMFCSPSCRLDFFFKLVLQWDQLEKTRDRPSPHLLFSTFPRCPFLIATLRLALPAKPIASLAQRCHHVLQAVEL